MVAESEAKITANMGKEELTRQRIAKESANAQLAIVRNRVEQERLLCIKARKGAFEELQRQFG